jgi:RNA polymerase sigma factor for flagellar operon FliA
MENPLADAQLARAGLERLFLQSLPDIEHVSRFIARRQRLSATETEDFLSEVNLAFVRSDYAVLAAFEGRSSLRTYLTIVIQRLFLDYRRKQWGKWRPSAAALRRGPLAMRLEILLYREGLTLDAALETLRTNFSCAESREAMTDLAQALPARVSRRGMMEGADSLASVPAPDLDRPDVQLEGRDTSVRAQGLVNEVMEAFEPQDRIVLRMRFEDEIPVARIARTLGLDQKRLYRRMEELLAGFRKSLQDKGLGWPEVAAMIERGQCHLCLPPLAPETGHPRPSPEEAQA